MKKLALTTLVMAGLIVPTVSFADNLFPNLTYPTVWGPSLSDKKSFAEIPIVLPKEDE